jgi:hypothetical protein
VHAGQTCFLSQSQWRQLLRNSAASPAGQGPPSLSLRAKLCDLLVDIPDLLSELSNLSNLDGSRLPDQSDIESRHECILLRAIAISRRIRTWHVNEFEPLLLACRSPSNASLRPNSPPWDIHTDTGKAFEYPELLLAVLDCVSNSVLVRLEKLLLTLTPASLQQREELQLDICPATIARRQATIRKTFNFVKRSSTVAAKPLEFGLQQLWSADLAIDRYSISEASKSEAQQAF